MSSLRHTTQALPAAPEPRGVSPEPRTTATAGTAALIDATRDLLLVRGPGRVTLSEVARRAGVSRMTVYRRYGSVEGLLSAAMREEMAALLLEVVADQPDYPDAAHRVAAETVSLVSAIRAHTLLSTVLQRDPQALVPFMVDRFGSGQRMAMAHLERRLAEGMAALGGDGSVADDDPRALAMIVLLLGQSFVFTSTPIRGVLPEHDIATRLHSSVLALVTAGGSHG